MSRALAGNVWVDDVLYKAGTVPPKDVADRITNPKAWNAPDPVRVVPSGDAAQAAKPDVAPSGSVFDPSEHTVAEVLAYLKDADDDEKSRVIEVERSVKGRATITSA